MYGLTSIALATLIGSGLGGLPPDCPPFAVNFSNNWQVTAPPATTTCALVLEIPQGPYTFRSTGSFIAYPAAWGTQLEYWFALGLWSPESQPSSQVSGWSHAGEWTFHFHQTGPTFVSYYSRLPGDVGNPQTGSRWGFVHLCVVPNPRPMEEWNAAPTAALPEPAPGSLTGDEWIEWTQAEGQWPYFPIACQGNSGAHLKLLNVNDPEQKIVTIRVQTPGAFCTAPDNGPDIQFSNNNWEYETPPRTSLDAWVNVPAPRGNPMTDNETATYQQTVTLTDDLGRSTVLQRTIHVNEGPVDFDGYVPWTKPWAGYIVSGVGGHGLATDVFPVTVGTKVHLHLYFASPQQVPEPLRPSHWRIEWGDGEVTEWCADYDPSCTPDDPTGHTYTTPGLYKPRYSWIRDGVVLDAYARPITVVPTLTNTKPKVGGSAALK